MRVTDQCALNLAIFALEPDADTDIEGGASSLLTFQAAAGDNPGRLRLRGRSDGKATAVRFSHDGHHQISHSCIFDARF